MLRLLPATLLFTLAALASAGCNQPSGTAPMSDKPAPATQAAPAGEAAAPANARRIEIAVVDEGFQPANIDVKKGETVVLRFNRTTKSECLKAIEIPDLGVKKDLPLNTPVEVAITPQKEGKMVLQCWMAMIKATINVAASS